MADRNNARLFKKIFEELSKDKFNKEDFIFFFWDMIKDYDFHPSQMYCDEALINLKLAKKEDEKIEYEP